MWGMKLLLTWQTTVVLFLFYFFSVRDFLVDVIQKLHILNNFVLFCQISQGSGLSFSANHDTSPKAMTTHKMTETNVWGLLWWCQTLGAKALAPNNLPSLRRWILLSYVSSILSSCSPTIIERVPKKSISFEPFPMYYPQICCNNNSHNP